MSRPNAVYICGADALCAPCQSGKHEQCSWDGCPDCECAACPEERKAANRAALDAEIGTAYGPDGELLPEFAEATSAPEDKAPTGGLDTWDF